METWWRCSRHESSLNTHKNQGPSRLFASLYYGKVIGDFRSFRGGNDKEFPISLVSAMARSAICDCSRAGPTVQE